MKPKFYHKRLSNIHPTAIIGEDTVVHSHVWIGEDVVIGKNCRIQAFVFIPKGVTIGDNVFIGPHVSFTNDKNPPSKGRHWSKTVVGQRAVIGAGAVILPGITISPCAHIGAGAVVTKDVAFGTTVVGNPARVLAKKRK